MNNINREDLKKRLNTNAESMISNYENNLRKEGIYKFFIKNLPKMKPGDICEFICDYKAATKIALEDSLDVPQENIHIFSDILIELKLFQWHLYKFFEQTEGRTYSNKKAIFILQEFLVFLQENEWHPDQENDLGDFIVEPEASFKLPKTTINRQFWFQFIYNLHFFVLHGQPDPYLKSIESFELMKKAKETETQSNSSLH